MYFLSRDSLRVAQIIRYYVIVRHNSQRDTFGDLTHFNP